MARAAAVVKLLMMVCEINSIMKPGGGHCGYNDCIGCCDGVVMVFKHHLGILSTVTADTPPMLRRPMRS